MFHGALFNHGFIDVRGREAGMPADSVGAEESFGEMIFLKGHKGFIPHNGFRGTLQFAADQDDAEPVFRQLKSMRYRVGHKGSGMFRQIRDHGAGSGSGIQIDKIFRFDQGSGILSDPKFFFPVQFHTQGDFFFPGCKLSVILNGSAEYFYQRPLFIQDVQISSYGRFRCLKIFCQFLDGYASFCFQLF